MHIKIFSFSPKRGTAPTRPSLHPGRGSHHPSGRHQVFLKPSPGCSWPLRPLEHMATESGGFKLHGFMSCSSGTGSLDEGLTGLRAAGLCSFGDARENLFPHLFQLLEAAVGPISWLMGPSSTFNTRNVAFLVFRTPESLSSAWMQPDVGVNARQWAPVNAAVPRCAVPRRPVEHSENQRCVCTPRGPSGWNQAGQGPCA